MQYSVNRNKCSVAGITSFTNGVKQSRSGAKFVPKVMFLVWTEAVIVAELNRTSAYTRSATFGTIVAKEQDHIAPPVKPGLHIVVTTAECVCDDARKKILNLVASISCFQHFDTCDHYNDMETKPYLEGFKNMFASLCLRGYDLYGDQA